MAQGRQGVSEALRGGGPMNPEPESIYLLDMGNEWVWCDVPDPDYDDRSPVKYVRADRLETLTAERERYKAGLEAASHFAWSRPPIERRQGSPWNELFALCQAALEPHPEASET